MAGCLWHLLPAYAAAVAQARLPAGGVAVDVGCGTGRAARGPARGRARRAVIGLDLAPQTVTRPAVHSGGGDPAH
ncbi:hypothetical protein [Plantactinospora sp. DSM 117369]